MYNEYKNIKCINIDIDIRSLYKKFNLLCKISRTIYIYIYNLLAHSLLTGKRCFGAFLTVMKYFAGICSDIFISSI